MEPESECPLNAFEIVELTSTDLIRDWRCDRTAGNAWSRRCAIGIMEVLEMEGPNDPDAAYRLVSEIRGGSKPDDEKPINKIAS